MTPAGGAAPGRPPAAFDQQPIEVAALADACARAATVDDDTRWIEGIAAALAWFAGDNDGQHVMWDPDTGGGFDGLMSDRREPQPGRRVDPGPPRDAASTRGACWWRRDEPGDRRPRGPRSSQRLTADPSRVITRLFVPGQEGFEHQESRATQVVDRVLALDEDEAQQSLDDVMTRFEGRHRDLRGTFRRHAAELADRLDPRQRALGHATAPARRHVHQ